MKGIAATTKNSCSDHMLVDNPSAANGPRPWANPQIDKKQTTNIEVLMPRDPKRKADQSKNGIRE